MFIVMLAQYTQQREHKEEFLLAYSLRVHRSGNAQHQETEPTGHVASIVRKQSSEGTQLTFSF